MITTLYINGAKMDAPENLNITLTYRSAAFTSVDKINNSYSNTITLPRTAHNEAVLGGVVFPSTESAIPYAYLPASVMIDGVMVVPSAVAYITEVTDNSIKVAVMWDSVVKLASIVADGRQLNELPYNYSEDVFLWDRTKANTFPTADYGFTSDDSSIANHPVYTVKDILQRICNVYDIPMPSDEDLEPFGEWCMPLTTRIDPIIEDGEPLTENNVSHWYGNTCAMLRPATTTKEDGSETWRIVHELWCGRIGKANGVLPEDSLPDINLPAVLPKQNIYANDELIDFDTPVIDESGKPLGSEEHPDYVSRELRGIVGDDGSSKYLRYFAPKFPNMEFICSGDLFIPLKDNNTASASFILGNLKLRLALLYRFKNSDSDYNEEELLTIDAYSVTDGGVRFKFDNEKSSAIPHPLMGVSDIYNNIECRVQWRLEYEAPSIGYIGIKEGLVGNGYLFNEERALSITAKMHIVQLDTFYYPIPNFPQMTVIAFLKAIGQMSGKFLTIETTTKKVGYIPTTSVVTRFRSYQEFEDNKKNAYDWSNYLIRGTGSVDTMQFKIGEWGQRNTFAYKDGKTWEEKNEANFFINNKSLKAEYKAVELPFTAPISKDDKQTIHIPLYHYEENNTRAVYDDADERAYIAENNGNRLRCTLGWDNLIGRYVPLFQALRNVKVIKEQIRIPMPMLQTLDLYKPVYLRQYGNYFAIIELRTRANGIADVELLKI